MADQGLHAGPEASRAFIHRFVVQRGLAGVQGDNPVGQGSASSGITGVRGAAKSVMK
jgi:hypothetical protein